MRAGSFSQLAKSETTIKIYKKKCYYDFPDRMYFWKKQDNTFAMVKTLSQRQSHTHVMLEVKHQQASSAR